MKRSGRTTPIGLDIGRGAVKAAQLAPRGRGADGWRLTAATLLPHIAAEGKPGEPDLTDAALWRRIVDSLERQGFEGREVIVAAPTGALLSGVFELPPRTSGAPLDQLARVELAQATRCDVDSFEMAMWDLPAPARGGSASHVMAAGCPVDKADELLDAVEAAGLLPLAMDVHPWTIARACEPLMSESAGITAVVDLGWTRSVLVLLYQGVVVYERAMSDAGYGAMQQSLSKSLHMDAEALGYLLTDIGLESGDESRQDSRPMAGPARQRIAAALQPIADDLRTSLSYAQLQYPDAAVDRVLLMGGGAAIRGIGQWLSAALEAPARVVRPTDLVECPPALGAISTHPALCMSLGLALHEEMVTS